MDSISGQSFSPTRHRVLRHAARTSNNSQPLPPAGQIQVYSFNAPGLEPSTYTIQVDQQVIATSSEEPSESQSVQADISHTFQVLGPDTSSPLDSSVIHSTFPSPGISAQSYILPQITFNDPSFPWRQEVPLASNDDDAMRTPWLIVVAFEQSEVTFIPRTVTTPDSIVIGKDLLYALFSDDGKTLSVERYKYLAHARSVNATYMTGLGAVDNGTFSVVISHRTGPFFDSTQPAASKPCVVHVIPISWPKGTTLDSLVKNNQATLTSLYHWAYDCVPPKAINLKHVLKVVGKNSGVFGPSEEIIKSVGADSTLTERIRDRMRDGYTLVRYIVQTGEETIALMRGPLTPRNVPFPQIETNLFQIHVNSGSDLQIVDSKLGLIDISYSAAWEIGRALAVADGAFSAALLRIRAWVYDQSRIKRKNEMLYPGSKSTLSEDLIGRLNDTFQALLDFKDKLEPPGPSRLLRSPLMQSHYAAISSDKLASFTPAHNIALLGENMGGLSATAGTNSPFTDFSKPVSTDWSFVVNWVMDRMYLQGIPSHYLIPDPTWLPPESIRFFHVDKRWLSALIDGALSICNHGDSADAVRKTIKAQLQLYLDQKMGKDLSKPQVPAYGFYLRSVVVSSFPDLVVEAPFKNPDPRAQVLLQENVRKDIMFCLLDRSPDGEGDAKLDKLIISQPPHQQIFAFSDESMAFTDKGFEVEIRKIYKSQNANAKMDALSKIKCTPNDSSGIYDWTWRTIKLKTYASLVQTAFRENTKLYLQRTVDTSVIGMQPNITIYGISSSGTITFVLPLRPTPYGSLPPFSEATIPNVVPSLPSTSTSFSVPLDSDSSIVTALAALNPLLAKFISTQNRFVYYQGTVDAGVMGIQLNETIYQLSFSGTTSDSDASVSDSDSSERPSFPSLPSPPEATTPEVAPSRQSTLTPLSLSTPLVSSTVTVDAGIQLNKTTSSGTTSDTFLRPSSPLLSPEATTPKVVLSQQPSSISPLVSSTAMTTGASENTTPRFDVTLRPYGSPTGPNKLHWSTFGTDIIFRILRNGIDKDSTDVISNIKFSFKCGDSSDCLFARGPAFEARMLSNQRFIPIFYGTPGGTSISQDSTFVLKPRAAQGTSPLKDNKELSFVIIGAILNKNAQSPIVNVVEDYLDDSGRVNPIPRVTVPVKTT